MAINVVAQVVSIGPYNEESHRAEVKMIAKRDGVEMDATSQLFVIPTSTDANQDIADAVKGWLEAEWAVSWGPLDNVLLYGGAQLL